MFLNTHSPAIPTAQERADARATAARRASIAAARSAAAYERDRAEREAWSAVDPLAYAPMSEVFAASYERERRQDVAARRANIAHAASVARETMKATRTVVTANRYGNVPQDIVAPVRTTSPARSVVIETRFTRGRSAAAVETNDDGRTLFGYFSKFNAWYEVNSFREGRFMERVAPGAFKRAFADQVAQVRVMFEHGQDPTVGNKPLGDIVVLREDEIGPYYEVRLFDAAYVNDLIPAFGSNQTGSSFRFSVPAGGDRWEQSPKASPTNPNGLPERTITDTDLYEFGPVVWGASPTATSNVR